MYSQLARLRPIGKIRRVNSKPGALTQSEWRLSFLSFFLRVPARTRRMPRGRSCWFADVLIENSFQIFLQRQIPFRREANVEQTNEAAWPIVRAFCSGRKDEIERDNSPLSQSLRL
ncbi:hypothetical protein FRC16_001503 [Serendipita sp. 398]|nr:hypothetical protein FRC16_001503 [Serendipita sp. 398]